MEPSTQTHKKQGKKVVKALFFGIATFLIVAMSLFHALFERQSEEYKEHYKTYSSIIKERNNIQDSLLNELGRSLTIEEYKVEKEDAWEGSNKKLKSYTKVKKQLAEEHSFLGRSSFKFWLFLFGIVLLGFYFAVKSLIHDFKSSIKTGHEYISILGISVSLFWFYHLFFQTANDFYNETYLIFKIIISFVIAFFISRLIRYYAIKENINKILLDLIVRIKRVHFLNLLSKALYLERNKEKIITKNSLNDDAKNFDDDIKSTLKEIDVI